MDYYKIGQRIRKYRKAQGYSQEQLAERIGISVTHMSHIETGNTKLSLPVFAALARCLEVPADALLSDAPAPRSAASHELETILEDCSAAQIQVIAAIARAAKTALKKYTDR